MTSRPESVAAASSGGSDTPLPPGARAILRWLPTAEASGAFAGQHDQVHCPRDEVHARVSLWWSDGVVHPGEKVGPPRGGLVPGTSPTYCVALPGGGYLWVEGGTLVGWRAQSMQGRPLVRADGQYFDPGRYSVVQPYFRRHYERMTESAIRAALSGLGQNSASSADLARIITLIASAKEPVVCTCTGKSRTGEATALGLVVPESLLVDAGVLRVLVGEADAVEAAATLWRLASLIWDPVRVGRALAAEAVARNSGEPARGWPEAPLTEQAVAHIAAQAIRHHGEAVVRTMPAWLLGWVMIAKPVLGSVEPRGRTVTAALETADRVRVARVETQWHSMAAARLLLSRTSAEIRRIDGPNAVDWSRDAEMPVDLRVSAPSSRPDQADEPVSGMPLREAVRLAYHCDVRSWFGVVAEHL